MAIFSRVGTNDFSRNHQFFVRSDSLEVPDGVYFVGRRVTITYIQGSSRSDITATFAGYEEGTNYPVFYFDTAHYRGITHRNGAIIGVSTSQTPNTNYTVTDTNFVTNRLIGIGVDTPDYLESVTFPDFGLRRPAGENTDELTSQNRQVRVDSAVYTVGQRTTLSVLRSDGSVQFSIETEFAGHDPDTGGLFFNPVDPDGDGPLSIYRDGRQILLPVEKTTDSPAVYTAPQSGIVAETVGIGVPTPGITATFADYGLRDGTTNNYDSQGREIVIEKGAYQAGDSVRAWIVLFRDENGDVSHVEHAFEATVVGYDSDTGNLVLDPPSDVLSGTRIVAAEDKAATYTIADANLVTDAPLGIGFAYFADYGLRVPGQDTYNSQARGIEVEQGVHDEGDMVEIRIVDRRGGRARDVENTFEATFRGYDSDTGNPIVDPPSSFRSGRRIFAAGTRETTYTITDADIVTDMPLELGFARFLNVAGRVGPAGDFNFVGESADIRAGEYALGDTIKITIGGIDSEPAFIGYEEGTGYPVFRDLEDPDRTEYILTDEENVTVGGAYELTALVAEAYTTCFAPGTLIATPGGEHAVETLKPGDEVLTADGGVATVRFVGMQRVSTMFGPRELTHPVRILAGALGRNVPHTDLVVTKDHGMILDGVVCHAGALINGTSIIEVPTRELDTDPHGVVTWYHVETENHAALLANGAVAESFIDHVDRAVFGNYSEFVGMYGAEVPAMTEMNMPRAMSIRQLPNRIKWRLIERAEAILAPVARSA